MSDASTYTAAKYGLEAGYAEGYAAALRDAVEAVKARCSSDGEFMCVECEVSVAAIEALEGER